jgi:type III secretion protein S
MEMGESTIISQFQTMMWIVAIVSLPPLLAAMTIGLVVAILQAATQIQDQTLPLTVKVIAVGLTLALFGVLLTRPLFEQSNRIFEDFAIVTR